VNPSLGREGRGGTGGGGEEERRALRAEEDISGAEA
jgi:hypothetical protein